LRGRLAQPSALSSMRTLSLHDALPIWIVGDRELEIRMRRHDLVVLVERQDTAGVGQWMDHDGGVLPRLDYLVEVADSAVPHRERDRKSTRLNSSHQINSYALFRFAQKK